MTSGRTPRKRAAVPQPDVPPSAGDRPVPPRRWLLRLVTSFACLQGAVSMARPAVSYHALELGAGPRAVGLVTAAFALLPLAVAVPLGRRTDTRRCAPLLPAGAALIAAGCVLAATAPSLVLLGAWSTLLGLGHLVYMIGAQSLVARQSRPDQHDRNFGYFTVGGSMGQFVGPSAAGLLVGGAGASAVTGRAGAEGSTAALLAAGALTVCSYATLWRLEGRAVREGGRAADGPHAQPPVPVVRILRTRGVPAGIFASLAVLSATDVLTAYLPVVGEERGIAPGVVGLLLSLRAAASVLSRIALPRMSARFGRQPLLVANCLAAGALCALLAVPAPVWVLALALVLLGFCLGVGQPLTMSTVVQAAPDSARSTALALRLTGNRLGQVAAPAGAGLLAGAGGAAAPFLLLGAVLAGASATAARSRAGVRRPESGRPGRAGGRRGDGSRDGTSGKPQPRVTHCTRGRTDTPN